MERQFAYSGAIPLNTDLLSTNLDAYIGLAKLSAAVLGNSTLLNAFTCTPTAPASLQVSISPGEIYALEEIDPTAYGDLGTNTNSIVKQGVILTPTLLSITPPATGGYSQNYLIEFAFSQVDADSVVLAYYNASDPANPFSGPNNTGSSNFTVRQNTVAILAKAGIAAPTGTQTTPTPDSGYVGGFVVTVTNGQSTITSGNISTYQSASFITETLIQKISQSTADARYVQQSQIQAGTLVYGVDTSISANSIVSLISPSISSYTAGMIYYVNIANTNTGATTINFNSIGSKNVKQGNLLPLYAGALQSGMIAEFFYDGTQFQLLNPNKVSSAFQSYTTGSGTYSTPVGAIAIKGKIIGGGGGGGGSSSSVPGQSSGANGSNTTFGSYTAAYGSGGGNVSTTGSGGIASGGNISNINGSNGTGGVSVNAGSLGGSGGFSTLGGAGYGLQGTAGGSAVANTGSGGAGGGGSAPIPNSGSGGGAGATVEFIISNPSATYSYSVGTGGGGASEGSGFNGGNGASGIIFLEAIFS